MTKDQDQDQSREKFSTTVNFIRKLFLVTKPVVSGILPSISVSFALKLVVVTKTVTLGIFSYQIFNLFYRFYLSVAYCDLQIILSALVQNSKFYTRNF